MPLTNLHCHDTKVSDLSPLKGMQLTNLDMLQHTGVRPVATERDAADVPESASDTPVSDLSPLKGCL